MRRRQFLWLAGVGLVGCKVVEDGEDVEVDGGPGTGTGTGTGTDAAADGGNGIDACEGETVLLHDTHAQALYLDGSYGPLTGIVRVEQVVAGVAVTFDFWHGHGGVLHRFTLEPAHLAALKAHETIYVTTTTVDGHEHMLFVDPLDEAYRVDGAPDVEVPLGPC